MIRRVLWWAAAPLVLSLLVMHAAAFAVRPTEEVLERVKAEGRQDEYLALEAGARRRGLNQPGTYRLAAGDRSAVVGDLKALVILVDFSDNPATAGGAYADSSYFNNLLFSVNTPGYSMNDHYQEMSYGLVTVTGQAFGYFRMPQTYAYYVDGQRGFGSYPHNAQKLAEDAVDAAEAAGVDFSLYDSDQDFKLDGLFIVHAGAGYEDTGDLNKIHSHAWGMANPRNYNGISIAAYTMEPEEQGGGGPISVGVFSHEYGHFLGLPDLYDTDGSSEGLGRWCLMASGSWAGGGNMPAHMSAWCKAFLGWISPTNVALNMTGVQIPQAETDPVAYRLWAGGALGDEYFLVENRQAVKFDQQIRGAGLVIYHVDEAKGSNEQEWYPGHTSFGHYWVAVEQADGNFSLEVGSNTGDAGDTWPGSSNKRAFDDFSIPGSKAYSGTGTAIAVWNISNSDSVMTANLDIFFSQPHFEFEQYSFSDNGNGNGRPDPGEDVSLVITERNLGLGVTDAEFSVATDDLTLVFTDSVALVGSAATGAYVNNAGDPITFSVPSSSGSRATDFYITVKADGGAYVHRDTVRVNVGPEQILLVDDDDKLGPVAGYDNLYIIPVLDSLQVTYVRWEVETQGSPSGMENFPVVIWYTGDRRLDPFNGPDTLLTPSERTAIASYLDLGGHLFLTGQQIAYFLDTVDSTFLGDYLHAQYGGPSNDFIATGLESDVVGDQTKYVLGGAGGAFNQQVKDLLVPSGGAVPAFREENNPGNIMGIRYDGAYRVLFLGWGVEGIGDDLAPIFGANPKSVLIDRAINWLLFNAVFSGISLQPLVTNPGQDATHLTDPSITLHWNFHAPLGDPQDSVAIEVGSNTDWSVAEYWSHGPLATSDTSVAYGGPAVLPGSTYYWRIRVFAGGAWTTWTQTSFHMNAAPPAPALSSPVANQIATQNGPLLTTNKAADPENDPCTYDFEVYLDSALASLESSTSGVTGGATISWTVGTSLTEQGRYWWRARAHDGLAQGPWSGATSFRVDGINEAPGAPTLDVPGDSAGLFSSNLLLKWSGASDPDLVETLRYRVRLDTSASFATAVVYDSLSAESLFVAGALQPARRYHWKVTVFDKGGLEATSEARTFRNLVPGDANNDGVVSSADIVVMVNYVFKGGVAPDPAALADLNADCVVSSADIIYAVNYVFKGGPAPGVGCAALVP